MDGCNVTVQQAYAHDGQVTVVLRNIGNANVQFTLSGELDGGGQRIYGSVTLRLSRGQEAYAALMRMPAGAGPESTLRLRAAACSLLSG